MEGLYPMGSSSPEQKSLSTAETLNAMNQGAGPGSGESPSRESVISHRLSVEP